MSETKRFFLLQLHETSRPAAALRSLLTLLLNSRHVGYNCTLLACISPAFMFESDATDLQAICSCGG